MSSSPKNTHENDTFTIDGVNYMATKFSTKLLASREPHATWKHTDQMEDHPSKQGGRKRETNSISKHGPTPRWLPLELNLYLISWWLMYHDSNHRIQLIDLFIGDKLCSKNISCNLSHLCVYYCSGTILYIYIYIRTLTNRSFVSLNKKNTEKNHFRFPSLRNKIWVWPPTEAVHQSWAAHNEIVGCQSNLLWVPP